MPEYRGEPLDAARGPGYGCFYLQLVVLVVLIVATPIAVVNGAPDWLNAALLVATLVLLLFVGQTLIFLLRIVAAESRGRRRPLASATRTVGEIEDTDGPIRYLRPDSGASTAARAAGTAGAAGAAGENATDRPGTGGGQAEGRVAGTGGDGGTGPASGGVAAGGPGADGQLASS